MSRNLVPPLGTLFLFAVTAAIMLWWWSPVLPAWVNPFGSLRIPLTGTRPTAGAIETEVTPTLPPVLAPHCPPGKQVQFVLGFAELKRELGDIMGDPVECEHVNPENGDTVQQTTSGLAVFRKRDGQLAFTDGWQHWARTPDGIATWTGDQEPLALRQ